MDDPKKLTKIVHNPHVDLNNARNLRSKFPFGSEDFFKANSNETKTSSQLSDTYVKHYEAQPLGKAIPRKKESMERITVRYRLCRVRPLDPDNATGSTKDLTDGLCRCGLLSGDDPTKIILIVEQDRVEKYSQERTEITIEWPEV